MNHQEIGMLGVDWMDLTHDRHKWQAVARNVMNLRVPGNKENFFINWRAVSFSRRTLLYGFS